MSPTRPIGARAGYLQVMDPSVGEVQDEDHGPSPHIQGVGPFLVVHADVVLRLGEVEPGGTWWSKPNQIGGGGESCVLGINYTHPLS